MALTKITGQVVDTTTDLVVGVTTVGGGVSAVDGFFSGIVTFSQGVSIGGTLTYEDVTNIDSVGLITARAGVVVGSGVTLSKDGDGFFTGVVTATSYAGDGSGLTGIDATQIVTGNTSVQTVDTGSDGHVKVNTEGSERLRIDSSGRVGINEQSPQSLLDIHDGTAANDTPEIRIESFRPIIRFADRSSSQADAEICGDNALIFRISEESDNDTALTERVRIASDGKFGIGNNNPAFMADVKGATNNTIRMGNSDETGHGSHDCKLVAGGSYYHNIDFQASNLYFKTYNGSSLDERLRITSDGYLQQHKLIAVSYSDTREIALSQVVLDTSNFYNTTNFASDSTILNSNGQFVAPVHGIYRLYCRFTSDSDSGNRINVRLRKNGNTINEAYCSNESTTQYQSASSEIIMELDANEYFDLHVGALHTMSGAQHKVVNFHMLG